MGYFSELHSEESSQLGFFEADDLSEPEENTPPAPDSPAPQEQAAPAPSSKEPAPVNPEPASEEHPPCPQWLLLRWVLASQVNRPCHCSPLSPPGKPGLRNLF